MCIEKFTPDNDTGQATSDLTIALFLFCFYMGIESRVFPMITLDRYPAITPKGSIYATLSSSLSIPSRLIVCLACHKS